MEFDILLLGLTVHISIIYLFLLQLTLNCHHHYHDLIAYSQLRGRRPLLSNSFASIGVDSLGAVMFIKYLSDSLGGLRLEPAKIYAPGVTIR